jgi:hypothetical protein
MKRVLCFVLSLIVLKGFVSSPASNVIRALAETYQETERSAMDIKEIFAVTDSSHFSGDITEYLHEKTDYGEDLSKLNQFELTVYFVEELQSEVMNGGFDQYFFNSSGDHWEEAITACEAIGAVQTAGLLQKAAQAYGCELPKEREEREAAIESHARDGYDEELAALDSIFYAYEENVDTLIFDYCQQNKKMFFN